MGVKMKRKAVRKSKSKVNQAGNYTKPTMRKRLFNKIKAGSKVEILVSGVQEKRKCWLNNIKLRVVDISKML